MSFPRLSRLGGIRLAPLLTVLALAVCGGDPAESGRDAGPCGDGAASCGPPVDAAREDGAGPCPGSSLRCQGRCVACDPSGVATATCDGELCVASSCELGFSLEQGRCRPWQVEPVVEGGHSPTLGVASDGALYLAYATEAGILMWVRRGAGLHTETLVATVPEVAVLRLALDATASPLVVSATTTGALALAELSAGTWAGQALPVEVAPAAVFDLGLRRGQVPVMCLPAVGSGLELAQRGGEGWTRVPIAAETVSGCALDVGRSGGVHVAFDDRTTGDLLYSHGVQQIWPVETVASAGDVGRCIDLALDRDGQPQLSYTGEGNVYHARRVGGVWERGLVDTQSGPGGCSQTAIAVDDAGRVYIAYTDWDFGAYELKLAKHRGGRWDVDRVDTALQSAPAMALDPLSRPVLTYVSAGVLKLARAP